MTNVKNYVFDFVSTAPVATTRIPVSALTIRRRKDSVAFCSVTIPQPNQLLDDGLTTLADLIAANPNGEMLLKQTINGGAETLVGTYTLDQVLTTDSSSVFTVVLNGINDFGADQASSGSYVIDAPITTSNDSTGLQRFSAAEDALIVVDDQITLQGSVVNVEEISLFVNVVNSRMDLGVS